MNREWIVDNHWVDGATAEGGTDCGKLLGGIAFFKRVLTEEIETNPVHSSGEDIVEEHKPQLEVFLPIGLKLEGFSIETIWIEKLFFFVI